MGDLSFVDPRAFAIFLELHRGLPRQAPGGTEHTLRALDALGPLSERPRILDLGCGPGAQTLDLLGALPGATAVAVDQLPPMLAELRTRAATAGVEDRLTLLEADMGALPPELAPGSFDLVWSEGAAYALGFDRALSTWRPLLRPEGGVGLSELCWRVPVDEAPEPARAFWAEAYPAMRTHEANQAAFERAGFALSAHFMLPASAWWAPYYTPLEARLERFLAAHPGDPAAVEVVEAERREIALFRDHGHSYGYGFYVGRRR